MRIEALSHLLNLAFSTKLHAKTKRDKYLSRRILYSVNTKKFQRQQSAAELTHLNFPILTADAPISTLKPM